MSIRRYSLEREKLGDKSHNTVVVAGYKREGERQNCSDTKRIEQIEYKQDSLGEGKQCGRYADREKKSEPNSLGGWQSSLCNTVKKDKTKGST